MDRFYESSTSLFVRAYDAFHHHAPPPIAGDVDFYEGLARATGGPVLELACGTGRIALPLAERGLDITGVDASDGMLAIAERKSAALPVAARRRLTLVSQDMTEFALDRRFGCIFVAFRSFQHILTVDLQRRALAAMRRHLAPDGRLALHLFDPRLELLIDGYHAASDAVRRRADDAAPVSSARSCAPASIIRRRSVAISGGTQSSIADGAALEEATREMALRWTWRWELRHLLELCGFGVVAEYSDFALSGPAYGKELIVRGGHRLTMTSPHDATGMIGADSETPYYRPCSTISSRRCSIWRT